MRNYPALVTALTAAVVATVNVLALVLEWTEQVTAGVNIAAAAWIGVLGWFISHTTLTGPQLDALAEAGE